MIGTVLDERYLILALLGQGSMSVVYKAEHQLMKRTVAIKMLNSELASDPKSVQRFQQEARALSSLVHENIVAVHDFGVSPEGHPYLAMDFVQGETLSDVLKRQHHLPVERCLNIFRQACAALGHAHKLGIIHRDVKPTNIMLLKSDDGSDLVKLVDFGIAKLLDADSKDGQNLTASGEILGGQTYMSPEQCLGRPLDPRSDIYSLACLMFEALTGVPPFSAQTAADLVSKHINEPPAWPPASPAVPERLKAVVLKAMAKDPACRQSSMPELAQDLPLIAPMGRGQTAPHTIPSSRARLFRCVVAASLLAAAAISAWIMLSPDGRLLWACSRFYLQDSTMPQSDPRRLDIAVPVAKSLAKSGRYEQAAKIYEQCLSNASQRYGARSLDFAEFLVQTAKLQDLANKKESAKALYTQANEIMTEIYRQPRYLHNNEEGLRITSLLADARRRILSPNDPELGRIIYLVGVFSGKNGLTNEAARCYEEAIPLLEQARPLDSEDLGWACFHLASIYNSRNKIADSERYFKNSVTYLSQTFGDEDAYSERARKELAEAYLAEGKRAEAQEMYRSLIALQKKTLGPSDDAVARNEFALALLDIGQPDYAAAEQLLVDSQKIFLENRQYLPASDITLYRARLLMDQAKYSESLPWLERTFKLYQDSGQVDTERRLDMLARMIDSLQKLGRAKEAEVFRKEQQELNKARSK